VTAETQTSLRTATFATTLERRARGAGGAHPRGEALENLPDLSTPLYAFVRREGNNAEDAQDLTQEFFARLVEKNYLAQVEH
jgi:RNA polymerase sigma-70 factor (ECF subfamily)